MKCERIISKEEIKAISRLLSGSTSAQHRNGIIIGHSLGLKPIDMVILFLENKQGWKFDVAEYTSFTNLLCSKQLLANKFEMEYTFYSEGYAVYRGNDLRFETSLNEKQLKYSTQLPTGIKHKPSPMGHLVRYLLKLINREISHLKKHSVY